MKILMSLKNRREEQNNNSWVVFLAQDLLNIFSYPLANQQRTVRYGGKTLSTVQAL